MHEHDRSQHRNRLADETSPYLLQHAANPVDWYPWGAEAFTAARQSGRPILLSIGYSACHWCHVMAHESFEDAATAAVMNSLFVNIKVDREERPDVDRIYQIAHQMLTQHGGGWPLTMFLTPEDQVPFFGGTYFPPVASHGMPAFADLLQRVAQYHAEHRADIAAQNGRLVAVFDTLLPAPADASQPFTAEPLTRARAELATDFDGEYGGFTGTPKFPHPLSIERLLRGWQATSSGLEPDLQALYMATLTLTRMAEGGIYDQLGGGFARYSVDAWWMIPHFEKMLYDNGPLLALYAQAACATGEVLFRRIANETADWALRDMQSPAGGFYSTLDADSEGHEGKFYVWRPEEVSALLTADEYQVVAPRFGLDREANFEGQWHLHVFASVEDIAANLSLEPAVVEELIDSARGKLLSHRAGRIWPGRDEKILTGWNGLMIRGLAIASRCLQRADLAAAATRAVDFLRANVWREGRLYAVAKDGRTRFPAYLDDHAFLADGLLELLQCRWRSADLDFLVAIVEVLLTHFEDREAGGFYFTADDAEQLLHRSKSFGDDATPSGNGVIASVLGRLGHLLGEPRYLQAAERVLRAGWQPLDKYPQGHGALLNALDEQLHPVQTLVIRGAAAESADWARELSLLYAPRRLVVAIPADATDLPPALATKAAGSRTVAYVCEGMTCGAPVASLAQLIRQLRSETRG